MTRNLREHLEVEIALLAGVLGFFLGGLVNVRKEIIDIVFAAVVTGVLVFFTAYFAMSLVFAGTRKNDNIDEDDFKGDNFDRVKSKIRREDALPNTPIRKQNVPAKGKKIDIVSQDDTLFDDIYKK